MFKTPTNAISHCFLQYLLKDNKSIGIVLDIKKSNQIVYDIFHEVNKYEDLENNICFFGETWDDPVLTPPTACYHSLEMTKFRGSIISFNIEGIISALRCPNIKNILFYIYNINELMAYNQEEIIKILKDPRIKKIVRSNDYNKLIQSSLHDFNAKVMNYPDLKEIIKYLL